MAAQEATAVSTLMDGVAGATALEQVVADVPRAAELASTAAVDTGTRPVRPSASLPSPEPAPEAPREVTPEDLKEAGLDIEEYLQVGLALGYIKICAECGRGFLAGNAHRLADLDPDGDGKLVCGQCRDAGRGVQ